MGLSVANALDPIFGSTVSIVGRLTFYTSLVIFLIINGHHMILSGLYESFRALPLGTLVNIKPVFSNELLEVGVVFWQVAVQLAAPAVMVIFLSDFAFGIVSRVAPQVNVFMLGFQVKPTLGLWAILMTLPLFIRAISLLIGRMGEEIFRLFIILR
jgi:flagellar biosynthesis protein FliR